MNRRSAPILLLLAALASCTGFHTVVPGEVYRDRQPHEDELIRAIDRRGIKTVVCLRAGKETAVSERAALVAGIDFVRVPMSAMRLPQPETLLQLWRVIATAERPLLFHCRAGVDRTGLACALAVLHDTGDLQQARGQLALLPFGHLAAFGTEAMDAVLDRYAPHHGSMAFPEWVETVYAPDLLGK